MFAILLQCRCDKTYLSYCDIERLWHPGKNKKVNSEAGSTYFSQHESCLHNVQGSGYTSSKCSRDWATKSTLKRIYRFSLTSTPRCFQSFPQGKLDKRKWNLRPSDVQYQMFNMVVIACLTYLTRQHTPVSTVKTRNTFGFINTPDGVLEAIHSPSLHILFDDFRWHPHKAPRLVTFETKMRIQMLCAYHFAKWGSRHMNHRGTDHMGQLRLQDFFRDFIRTEEQCS